VVSDGVVVREAYGLGAGPADRFTSWSMAKSILSTLVGVAVAEGKIRSLDDPASLYAPELKDTAYGATPIRDLLTMSSGIAWNDDSRDPKSDVTKLFKTVYILGGRVSPLIAGYPREHPSGTGFHYISSDPQALSAVLRGAVGKPVGEYLSQKLWAPLGMSATALWSTDRPGGDELGFCCLSARLEDYARFGALMANNGNWRGRQLVPAAWVSEAATPGRSYLQAGQIGHESAGYGYLWWSPKGDDGEFYAEGVYGQVIWIDRKRGVVIAMTADDPDMGAHRAERTALLRALARTYARPPSVTRP
jgi:CubicO group peptidase (beta-lactamase class C family)